MDNTNNKTISTATDDYTTLSNKLLKELHHTRILSLCTLVLLLCLLAGGGFCLYQLLPMLSFASEARPVVQQLADIDVHTINSTLSKVDSALDDVDLVQLSGAIERLDIDSLNATLQGLDIEEFTTALKNLNAVAKSLQEVSDKFSALFH